MIFFLQKTFFLQMKFYEISFIILIVDISRRIIITTFSSSDAFVSLRCNVPIEWLYHLTSLQLGMKVRYNKNKFNESRKILFFTLIFQNYISVIIFFF